MSHEIEIRIIVKVSNTHHADLLREEIQNAVSVRSPIYFVSKHFIPNNKMEDVWEQEKEFGTLK